MRPRPVPSIYRGQVYFLDLNMGVGPKPYLVVSNNARNASKKGDYLGVRVTTTPPGPARERLATIVPVSDPAGSLTGWALCDDIYMLYDADWVTATAMPAQVPPRQMAAVDAGLRHALGL